MTYIDLNIVRSGVVENPSDWIHAGYHEIQSLPERYKRIDVAALTALLRFADAESLRKGLRGWVDEALAIDVLEAIRRGPKVSLWGSGNTWIPSGANSKSATRDG